MCTFDEARCDLSAILDGIAIAFIWMQQQTVHVQCIIVAVPQVQFEIC